MNNAATAVTNTTAALGNNLQSVQSPYSDLSMIIGIIGLIATIIGTFLAISSWYQSKKSKKLYEHIFKAAEREIDAELTEQDLHLKKEELSKLSNRVITLQEQIQKEIPIEARKAVLRDRLENAVENMKKFYDEVISLKGKLSGLGESKDIPKEILKSIQDEIEPKFIIRERISTLKTYLTILTSAAGLSFAILPYPFRNIVGATFFIGAIPIIIWLAKLAITITAVDKQKFNLNIKLFISVALSISSTFSSLAIMLIGFSMLKYHEKDASIPFLMAFSLLILSVFFAWLSFRLAGKRRKINHEPNIKSNEPGTDKRKRR